MANYGPASIKIDYDNGSGTPVDITAYVLTINSVDVEQVLEEVRPFGASWDKYMPVGVGKMGPIELGGIFDDTAVSGPDALFAGRIPEAPGTATRTLKVTWGGSKSTSVETHLGAYKRQVDKQGLTKYSVTLTPTGAVTEA